MTLAAGDRDTVLQDRDAARHGDPAPGSPAPGADTSADPDRSAQATPGEAPPPVDFPEGEAPHGEVESEGPARDGLYGAPSDAPRYDDSKLVSSSSKRIWDFTAGLSYSWLSEQLVLGPVASFGQQGFWLDFGMPPIFTLNSAPELEGNYLGQRFELALGYAPLDTMKWRVRFSAGADIYALWGIDSEEAKAALALKADVTYWAAKHFGVELGVRGYPLASDGLSVEEGPGGVEWLPFFFTTTLHFRSPGEHE